MNHPAHASGSDVLMTQRLILRRWNQKDACAAGIRRMPKTYTDMPATRMSARLQAGRHIKILTRAGL